MRNKIKWFVEDNQEGLLWVLCAIVIPALLVLSMRLEY